MIRSMTAFARQQSTTASGNLTLELRAVNHRYLEINPRLPEELRIFEPKIRAALGKRLSRGKIDCTMRYAAPESVNGELVINEEMVKQLAQATHTIEGILYDSTPISSLELLKWPGVITTTPVDENQVIENASKILDDAITELIEMRESEGAKLTAIILQRCDAIEAVIATVKLRLPEVLDSARKRLELRLADLKQPDTDSSRLEQEMVILAQRLDVDEELDRLETHLSEIRKTLKQSKPVGRRLDFLMQELNREANTLGSKSADIETTQASVELKVLIEQMREQIQNIE
ncbi:MAG TPA: YicC family protein [Ectothiorhodospiraceae bacterium]|nr:YicC family protein [Ectothiorhodospiraceae bacterium]